MQDIITIRGTVGSDPRHYISSAGVAVTTFRVATNHRVRDRDTGEWVDGTTNWYSVSAFRQLAENADESLRKGHRVIVQGRLKVRPWSAGDKQGTSIDIDADSIGHDLVFGRSHWARVFAARAEAVEEAGSSASESGSELGPEPEVEEEGDEAMLDEASFDEASVDADDGTSALDPFDVTAIREPVSP